MRGRVRMNGDGKMTVVGARAGGGLERCGRIVAVVRGAEARLFHKSVDTYYTLPRRHAPRATLITDREGRHGMALGQRAHGDVIHVFQASKQAARPCSRLEREAEQPLFLRTPPTPRLDAEAQPCDVRPLRASTSSTRLDSLSVTRLRGTGTY